MEICQEKWKFVFGNKMLCLTFISGSHGKNYCILNNVWNDPYKAYSNQIISADSLTCECDEHAPWFLFFWFIDFSNIWWPSSTDIKMLESDERHSETSVLLLSAYHRIKCSTWSITNLMIYSQHSVAHLTHWHGWTYTHTQTLNAYLAVAVVI